MLLLLAAHLLALPAFGLGQGWSFASVMVINAIIGGFALIAAVPALSRDVRALACVLGLLSCSAAMVMLWHGQIEAHFHYFVVVGAVALYEAWLPYLVAIAFVVLQHGAMSAFFPHGVFHHPMGGMQNPWAWAAIHGAFVGALASANLVSWRATDKTRRAQLRAQAEALEAAERFKQAFAAAPNGAAMLDEHGVIVEINPALAASVRARAADLQGLPWFSLLVGAERDAASALWPPRQDQTEGVELQLRRADGTVGWLLWQHSRMTGGGVQRWFSQTVDISDRKHAEDQLAFHATHDALTQLPNRREFQRLLQAALKGRRPHERVSLVFADVDDFKNINDSLGHAAGDELLVAVAKRLQDALKQDDVIGRFGGDEFVICLRIPDAAAAEARTAELAEALSEPFLLREHERFVTASFGLAMAGAADTDAEALLRDADVAMYDAKAAGKARFARFELHMRESAQQRLVLEEQLRAAVAAGALQVEYQVQIDLADGSVLGREAFARWPSQSGVTPSDFIPIAEHSGLILDLTAFVIRRACADAVSWKDGWVSVNISARVLRDPGFPLLVGQVLEDSGLPAERLVLELKQSSLTGRGVQLGALRALGVQVAIDNFGSGDTSLTGLGDLQGIDQLKLDGSLTFDLVDADSTRTALVAAIIGIALHQNVAVVATCLESDAQRDAVRALGCCIGQGFAIGQPRALTQLAAIRPDAAVRQPAQPQL